MVRIGLEVLPRSIVVQRWRKPRGPSQEIGASLRHPPELHPGRQGGGIAYNREEFDRIVRHGLELSPVHEVLVEESLLGWKEFEMEVMRDYKDDSASSSARSRTSTRWASTPAIRSPSRPRRR